MPNQFETNKEKKKLSEKNKRAKMPNQCGMRKGELYFIDQDLYSVDLEYCLL